MGAMLRDALAPYLSHVQYIIEGEVCSEISLAGVNGKSQPFQDFVQQDDPG